MTHGRIFGVFAMHGVPPDLDLSQLHGATLVFIGLGQFPLQFHFHPKGAVSVEGGWDLRDAAGDRIDGHERGDWRDPPPYHLHRLLGRQVTGSEVYAPASCALRFDNGGVL
jgi:hypothetical protein